ncbi:MAG: hypothetical protein AOA66_1226 [Candidatus Bathyarchaeota archaeon BA2]|nr:MAG: hypothetical protein AOA66_1226 [Candidatus Bathyarchaeota archaeon BA2]
MDKEDWCLLLFLLLSHHRLEKLHRTIHISFRGRNVYLCARCTGAYSGILSIFVACFLGFDFPTWLYPPLFSVLPIPAAVDFITQSCKLRESRNTIRVCTGYILGIGEGLFLLMLVRGMFHLIPYALAIFGAYIFSIYVIARKTKFLDSYFD